MLTRLLHTVTKRWSDKLAFFEVFVLEIDGLMGDLGTEENVDDWGVNSPYNRFLLMHEVKIQDNIQNVLYNICVGMRGAAEV